MKIEHHDAEKQKNEVIVDTSNELSRMTEDFEHFLNHSSTQKYSVQNDTIKLTNDSQLSVTQEVSPNVHHSYQDFSSNCIPTVVQEKFDILKIDEDMLKIDENMLKIDEDMLMTSSYEKKSEACNVLLEPNEKPHITQEAFNSAPNKNMQYQSHTHEETPVSVTANERNFVQNLNSSFPEKPKKLSDSIENTSNEKILPNSSDRRRSLSRVIDSINRNQMLLKVNCLSKTESPNRHAHQFPIQTHELRQEIESDKQIDEILCDLQHVLNSVEEDKNRSLNQ